MSKADVVVYRPWMGMDQSRDASLLKAEETAYVVNGELQNQRIRTRGGIRAWPLEVDGFLQGAQIYSPGRGLSQQVFGEDGTCIVMAAGGKRWSVNVPPAGGSGSPKVTDITGEFSYPPELQTVWIYQAESYILAQDGLSNTWIYDGQTATESSGLNIDDKEASELVNGATAGGYAHGRVIQTILNRVYIGDILHKTDRYEPSNILEMTEQLYYETGGFFSAPSNLGAIIAVDVVPTLDSTVGQGDVAIHCKNGIFTLDIGSTLRSQWASSRILRHVAHGSAAASPYAIAKYDGDQIFRSRYGLQSLRLINSDTQSFGGQIISVLSEGVRSLMEGDHLPFLRFASCAKWQDRQRLYTTVNHRSLSNGSRGGMGLVSLNFRPIMEAETPPSWEGMHTLPKEVAMISQILSGVFDDRERLFAICTSAHGEGVWLVEFTEGQLDDEIDGERRRIESQVVTREFTGGAEMTKKVFESGSLFFREIIGQLDWEVWVKTERMKEWEKWRSGSECCDGADDNCAASCSKVTHVELGLGEIPDIARNARKAQFLIKWKGRASLEGLRLRHSTDKSKEDGLGRDGLRCSEFLSCNGFDPWEYSNV